MREVVSSLTANFAAAYKKCRIAATTRPRAYTGLSVLKNFIEYPIVPLDDKGISHFLHSWTQILYTEQKGRRPVREYYTGLLKAVNSSPAIRKLALNPLMLTALAIIHWNQQTLPEQRAELYESIITWLLRSPREIRTTREEEARRILKTMAFGMQSQKGGRKIQAGKREAAEYIASHFGSGSDENTLYAAEKYLEAEESMSGIITLRGNSYAFRHLTFQEYLAAGALAGKTDTSQREILLKKEILLSPEWREVLLLFCGILCNLGTEKADTFFSHLLDWQDKECTTLQEKAWLFGLMGAIEQDLRPCAYTIQNPSLEVLRNEVMAIFNLGKARTIPLAVRSAAADALGQAGDPRLTGDTFVTIPGCTFLMGAQSVYENKPNYDPGAGDNEAPVHEVTLTGYRIGKYPVTVGEYARFIEDNGYEKKEYWKDGGYKQFSEPYEWETQQQFPTRPVTGVSWFEAFAYATWAGCTLPTEAQWERAARGAGEYRKYSWGNDDPGEETTNWGGTGLGHPSVVGLFPGNVTEQDIYDMCGNIWEWCSDWYGEYTGKSETDPEGPAKGGSHVVRGGSWWYNDRYMRSACRGRYGPSYRLGYTGLRLARDQKGKT